MQSNRSASIPIDHVLAELAAYPLASVASFEAGLTSLAPLISQQTGEQGATAALWRAAERDILLSTPSMSIDELLALRDFLWFHRPAMSRANPADARSGLEAEIPLWEYLKGLARSRLRVHGRLAVPTISRTESLCGMEDESLETRASRVWRWLSFALPPEVLLAGISENEGQPSEVSTILPTTERLLKDGGFAEVHLHRGAGVGFDVLWPNLARELVSPNFNTESFRSPGAQFDEGRLWPHWLIRCHLVRYLLAAFLAARDSKLGWDAFYARVVQEVFGESLTDAAVIWDGVDELWRGKLRSSAPARLRATFEGLVRALRALGVTQARYERLTVDTRWELDPIFKLLGARHPQCNPEVTFVRLGLEYLERTEGRTGRGGCHNPSSFARLFWQTIRVRSLFYRHLIQRPLIPGLQWFVRHYSRLSPARRRISYAFQTESGIRMSGYGKGLKSWECRVTPPGTISEFVEEMKACAEVARRMPELSELGVVIHFPKLRSGGAESGLNRAHWMFTTSDPGQYAEKWGLPKASNPAGCRYSTYFREQRRNTKVLLESIRRTPRLLNLVRGLDVCTDEMAVCNWVFTPLMRMAKSASSRAISAWYRDTGEVLAPLRQTAHAGEDFVHLMSGLRQVWEVVEFFQMKRGDRIGHGVALGIDPVHWCKKAGRIAMPQEIRLFDLAFVWEMLRRYKFQISGSFLHWLDAEINRLARAVFGYPLDGRRVSTLWKDMHNPVILDRAGFPSDVSGDRQRDFNGFTARTTRLALIKQYLLCHDSFLRGRETVWVDPSSELDVLDILQREIRRQLGLLGVAVEVNPSSNLLIGDLGDLQGHPLWRLNPPAGQSTVPPLQVVIGSDDPVTFACSLPQEYELVTSALMSAGLSEHQAQGWANQVREAGMRFRFTVPPSPRSGYRFWIVDDPPALRPRDWEYCGDCVGRHGALDTQRKAPGHTGGR